MRMLFAWIALGALVTGCLSTPGPSSGNDDGGGGDDGSGDIDASTDASAGPRCRPAGALPAGTAWPPPGIVVRHAQIADIDVDGTDDLIVTVAPEQSQANGASKVYVLYGPVDRAAPTYHASIDVGLTGSVIPWATTLARVDGDECLDLAVAGPPVMGSSRSFVALWRHGGGLVPWSGAPVRADLTREPPAGPLIVMWADLTTDSDADLVVADLNSVDLFVGATLAVLPGALNVPRPSPGTCDSWGNINALLAQPGTNGRERLIAFGHYRHNTVEVDDGGTITVSASCTDGQQNAITRGSAAFDLDGTPPLDLFSGGGGWVGAHLVAGTAAPVTPLQGAAGCINTPRGMDDNIEGFAAGHLGGFPSPEVVLIDHDDAPPLPGVSYACLLDAIDVTSTTVTRTAVNEMSIGAGVARSVAIGNLDGAPRVWILMRDGVLVCLQRGAAANLETCQ